MDRQEYQRIYQQCWRAANKDYIEWYREQNPRPKAKKQYVAKDAKHHNRGSKTPLNPQPRKERAKRAKLSNIERIRRKIDLELEKIEARRAEWRALNQQSNITDQPASLLEARP
jgi:D-alanyl-D-alanine dipeptidase